MNGRGGRRSPPPTARATTAGIFRGSGDPTINITLGIGLPGLFRLIFDDPRDSLQRRTGSGALSAVRPQRVPPPQIPQPPIPTPPPQPGPFPRTPPANDPVFSIGKAILIRGIGIIGAVLTIKDIFEMARDEREIERQRENKAITEQEIARRQRRRVFERDVRTTTIPGIEGAPTENPDVIRAPRRIPSPVPLPDAVPFPVGLPTPNPVIPAVPAPSPATPTPTPASPQLPQPTSPGLPNLPFALPFGLPFASPLGQPFSPSPVGLPSPNPTNLPQPAPNPLTPFNTPGVFFNPTADPNASPQTASQKCEAVQRRRRKKGKCREGFFVETPTETRFITWRERECDTVTGPIRKVFSF